jgi:hypothetical protein
LQVARTDFVRQITRRREQTLGITATRRAVLRGLGTTLNFDTLAPPYIQHDSSAKDGAGDFSLLLKYRLAAGNAENGD